MTKDLSASFTLLVTALMVVLPFGCGEAGDTGTGSTALEVTEFNDGECNRIVARALGDAQQCTPEDCACEEIEGAAIDFFGDQPFFDGPCTAAFAAGELNGLVGNAATQPAGPNAGAGKNIANVVCTSVATCDLCASVPPGTCVQCSP
jgi:hypothetical protein